MGRHYVQKPNTGTNNQEIVKPAGLIGRKMIHSKTTGHCFRVPPRKTAAGHKAIIGIESWRTFGSTTEHTYPGVMTAAPVFFHAR
jgi:hypothetical protein